MLSTVLSADGELMAASIVAVRCVGGEPRVSSAEGEKVALANARPSVGLSHLEVDKVEAELADVLVHWANLQLTVLHVTGHDRGKVGRHDVRDVVDDFLVTGCNDCRGWNLCYYNFLYSGGKEGRTEGSGGQGKFWGINNVITLTSFLSISAMEGCGW